MPQHKDGEGTPHHAASNHQSVMDLKPGEVSEVISDPNSGHYIYKLVSKETLTLDA
jgi:hypothetical protein